MFLIYLLIGYTQIYTNSGVGEFIISSPEVMAHSQASLTILEPFYNPSILSVRNYLSGSFNFEMVNHKEERTELVFDEFDNTIGEAVVYSKTWNYLTPSLFSLHYSKGGKGIGLFLSPVIDMTYNYRYIKRSDAYTVIRDENIERKGGVNSLSFGFGITAYKNIAIGGIVDYLFGKSELFHKIEEDSIITTQGSDNFSGFRWGAGVSIFHKYRWKIGISIRASTKLEGTTEYSLPMQISTGFSLTPISKSPMHFYLGYSYTNWEKVNSSYEDEHYFSIGFDHRLIGKTKIIFGAGMKKTYVDPYPWSVSYSFGFMQAWGDVDISTAISMAPVYYSLNEDGISYNLRENLFRLILGVKGKIRKF